MKMDSLDSLTHGGVRGRNFSSRRNSSYSIKEGDLQDEDMETDRADALLQYDWCMREVPL